MATELTPIEALDRDILNLCSRINIATYDLLILIREFDERLGWLKWGMQNCAQWLAWRCDFSMTTALEKVRVSHALKSLPAISLQFSTGKLSYSKVRALTRVASRQNEDELLAFANRSLRLRRDHQRGTMTVTVELLLDTGELLEKALDKARDDECLDTDALHCQSNPSNESAATVMPWCSRRMRKASR